MVWVPDNNHQIQLTGYNIGNKEKVECIYFATYIIIADAIEKNVNSAYFLMKIVAMLLI